MNHINKPKVFVIRSGKIFGTKVIKENGGLLNTVCSSAIGDFKREYACFEVNKTKRFEYHCLQKVQKYNNNSRTQETSDNTLT